MYVVFFSTTDVFRAEEMLNRTNIQCKVVPTPVQDKAYCGVCVYTENKKALELIKDMEFEVVF